jgi:hypothetical protein
MWHKVWVFMATIRQGLETTMFLHSKLKEAAMHKPGSNAKAFGSSR